MTIEKLWATVRHLVPVRIYPLLAPAHRLRRRAHLKHLEEDDRRYLNAHPKVVVPPARLRYNVAGPSTIAHFLQVGERTIYDIEAALRSVGRSLKGTRHFLDFGCGCGRLLLALQNLSSSLTVTGCDVDARAIGWCAEHLRRTHCILNDPLPPSPFDEGAFDLIWCGSVFTHLDEDRQDRWLKELHRILAPGGLLLASLHGATCWGPRLPSRTISTLRRNGMIFARTGTDNGIHPDWYQVAWHTEEYVRSHWATLFDIREYLPRGLHDYQDVVIAQKQNDRKH
jgi:SAM-dependent methyltransferase